MSSTIDEIKKRLEESSENWSGEWNWDTIVEHSGERIYRAWGEGPLIEKQYFNDAAAQARKDKDFIAHAKEDIYFLLSEIEFLREKIDQLEEDCWDY